MHAPIVEFLCQKVVLKRMENCCVLIMHGLSMGKANAQVFLKQRRKERKQLSKPSRNHASKAILPWWLKDSFGFGEKKVLAITITTILAPS